MKNDRILSNKNNPSLVPFDEKVSNLSSNIVDNDPVVLTTEISKDTMSDYEYRRKKRSVSDLSGFASNSFVVHTSPQSINNLNNAENEINISNMNNGDDIVTHEPKLENSIVESSIIEETVKTTVVSPSLIEPSHVFQPTLQETEKLQSTENPILSIIHPSTLEDVDTNKTKVIDSISSIVTEDQQVIVPTMKDTINPVKKSKSQPVFSWTWNWGSLPTRQTTSIPSDPDPDVDMKTNVSKLNEIKNNKKVILPEATDRIEPQLNNNLDKILDHPIIETIIPANESKFLDYQKESELTMSQPEYQSQHTQSTYKPSEDTIQYVFSMCGHILCEDHDAPEPIPKTSTELRAVLASYRIPSQSLNEITASDSSLVAIVGDYLLMPSDLICLYKYQERDNNLSDDKISSMTSILQPSEAVDYLTELQRSSQLTETYKQKLDDIISDSKVDNDVSNINTLLQAKFPSFMSKNRPKWSGWKISEWDKKVTQHLITNLTLGKSTNETLDVTDTENISSSVEAVENLPEKSNLSHSSQERNIHVTKSPSIRNPQILLLKPEDILSRLNQLQSTNIETSTGNGVGSLRNTEDRMNSQPWSITPVPWRESFNDLANPSFSLYKVNNSDLTSRSYVDILSAYVKTDDDKGIYGNWDVEGEDSNNNNNNNNNVEGKSSPNHTSAQHSIIGSEEGGKRAGSQIDNSPDRSRTHSKESPNISAGLDVDRLELIYRIVKSHDTNEENNIGISINTDGMNSDIVVPNEPADLVKTNSSVIDDIHRKEEERKQSGQVILNDENLLNQKEKIEDITINIAMNNVNSAETVPIVDQSIQQSIKNSPKEVEIEIEHLSLEDIPYELISPEPAGGDFYDSDTDSYLSGSLEDDSADPLVNIKKYRYRKVLVPNQENLQSLGLKLGENEIIFEVEGNPPLKSQLFLWNENCKIVIADTETMLIRPKVPSSGSMWQSFMGTTRNKQTEKRLDMAHILTSIQNQGYHILYIAQHTNGTTKDYLSKLTIGTNSTLPPGPIFQSPDSLVRAFGAERTDIFKAAALRGLKSLFPSSHNPYFGSFGTRTKDCLALTRCGVPEGRIFIVTDTGEIVLNTNKTIRRSLHDFNQQLQEIFPPLVTRAGKCL